MTNLEHNLQFTNRKIIAKILRFKMVMEQLLLQAG